MKKNTVISILVYKVRPKLCYCINALRIHSEISFHPILVWQREPETPAPMTPRTSLLMDESPSTAVGAGFRAIASQYNSNTVQSTR